MEHSTSDVTKDLAEVVWASHILSYLNPYTTAASQELVRQNSCPIDHEVDSDDGEDFDNIPDSQTASIDTDMLTANDEVLREKFLNCVSELLAHTKGGKYVTAAAMREKEDSVEIDIARNDRFKARDDVYLCSLAKFLAGQANPRQDMEDSHSFLVDTISYTANRIDASIKKAVELVKASPYRPSSKSSVDEPNPRTCLLGCCFEGQISAPKATQSLVLELLNYDFWQSLTPSGVERNVRRGEIVELAAAAMGSSQATQSELKQRLPSADPIMIINTWRTLARPVTNLRILAGISRLLPNFRSVTFIRVPQPPPVQLQSRQIPTLWEAWKYLDLPSNIKESIRSRMTKRGDDFRKECSRMLRVHCEIQLLMRYETEPSLTPTLAYFGCSKKACFLCHSFLDISPLRPRVRGRHGMCHPLWALQPCSPHSETVGANLNRLCEIVKQHIRALLNPGPAPSRTAIQQSSAVSELKSMLEIRRQSHNRQMADKDGQEYREKMQILLTIYYRDYDETTNKSVHAAVVACHGMTVPWNMPGDYVAMSGQSYSSHSQFRDITLADFRHVLDYFSTYFDETVREMPSGGSILAVKISSPMEQALYGRETFTSVAVDRDFPSTSDVSTLSEALGGELRVCKLDRDKLERSMELSDDPVEKDWYNPYTNILMTDIDPTSNNWGKVRKTWDFNGSSILLRTSRTDLDVQWAQHMVEYCLEVLKPLFDQSLARIISRQDVLGHITPDRMMAWRPIERSGMITEPRAERGFVARIGSWR